MKDNLSDSALVLINYNSCNFLSEIFKYLDRLVGRVVIYIIDDKSNDGSINEFKKKYKDKINFIINQKNYGAAYSRNWALKNINKKYLLFLDPDIKISAFAIAGLFAKREEGDIVFPRIEYFDGQLISPTNNFEKERCTNSAVFLINRERVNTTQQYFDTEMFIYVEDNDVFSRWWAFGLKFYYAENIVAYHPIKSSYSEKLFFYRVRNPFILFIKQAGIIPFRFNPFIWIAAYTVFNFMAALFNRNFSVAAKGFEKVRITNRPGLIIPRLVLIIYFLKAIFWIFLNLRSLYKKRKILATQLQEYKLYYENLHY